MSTTTSPSVKTFRAYYALQALANIVALALTTPEQIPRDVQAELAALAELARTRLVAAAIGAAQHQETLASLRDDFAALASPTAPTEELRAQLVQLLNELRHLLPMNAAG